MVHRKRKLALGPKSKRQGRRADRSDSRRRLAADIVIAYLKHHQVSSEELGPLIAGIAVSVSALGRAPPALAVARPAKLSRKRIEKSITNDGLISFENGKTYQMLLRHLKTCGLTIERYRAKWGLPPDYPAVAPAYAAIRSGWARRTGLGSRIRKARSETALAESVIQPSAA